MRLALNGLSQTLKKLTELLIWSLMRLSNNSFNLICVVSLDKSSGVNVLAND
jgi:hypothetical protein